MNNEILSSYNLAYLIILSVITNAYNKEEETITAFLPGNIGDRISFVLKTHGDEFPNIIDQEAFNKYTDKWLASFYGSLREASKELRTGYVALEDKSAISIFCSRRKAEMLSEVFNNNPLRDKINHFVKLLTGAFWLEHDDDPKLGV